MGKFLVNLLSTLLAIPAAVLFVAWILFVIFGQVTVRRLRKNLETKRELGIEFLSGWDILNVAQALSIPRPMTRKLENSRLSFLHANTDLLYKHTNWFDRFLARLFYWPFFLSVFAMIILMILNWLGAFG